MNPFEFEDAVSASDVGLVRSLLGSGADPNARLHGLDTPVISLAVENGDEPMGRLLVEYGADVDNTEAGVGNMLFNAVGAGDANPTVGLLLRLGADPNRPAHAGWTALHRAASLGYRQNVQILLQYGADPTIRTAYGLDVAQLARSAGHYDILTR